LRIIAEEENARIAAEAEEAERLRIEAEQAKILAEEENARIAAEAAEAEKKR